MYEQYINAFLSQNYIPTNAYLCRKIRIGWRNGGDTSSWGATVRNAMVSYCDDYNINHSVYWGLGKYTINSSLDDELEAGRPVIIFGLLSSLGQYEESYINHAVTAYGTHISGSMGFYIVNYGWSPSETAIELNSGLVGSITTFKVLSWPSC